MSVDPTEVNQDEAIIAQQRQIEKEIADSIKLVGDRMDLSFLLSEYPDEDDLIKNKIKVFIFFCIVH